MRVNWERWAAASGYVVVLFGFAGAAFERGGPPLNAPVDQTIAFFSKYRSELLSQSLMFVLSAGAYLWFFGVLRTFLLRAEDRPGTLSTIAFGAGIISAGIQMVFQGFQVALAVASNHPVEPTLAALFSNAILALSVIAYVPLAVMLAAVAVVSLRDHAFPAWLGWLSAFAAMAHVLMSIGLVLEGGPLVPGGTLTYGLYAVSLLWLVATTTVMVVRSGRPHRFEPFNRGGPTVNDLTVVHFRGVVPRVP
jgi:hypothetical protein